MELVMQASDSGRSMIFFMEKKVSMNYSFIIHEMNMPLQDFWSVYDHLKF